MFVSPGSRGGRHQAPRPGQYPGTQTNDSALAGNEGEFAEASASGVALSTGTPANVTSMLLSAGDWDVEAAIAVTPAGGATITFLAIGVSSGSASLPSLGALGRADTETVSTTAPFGGPTGARRFSLAAPTTIYAVALANFSGGTCSATADIAARRIR